MAKYEYSVNPEIRMLRIFDRLFRKAGIFSYNFKYQYLRISWTDFTMLIYRKLIWGKEEDIKASLKKLRKIGLIKYSITRGGKRVLYVSRQSKA